MFFINSLKDAGICAAVLVLVKHDPIVLDKGIKGHQNIEFTRYLARKLRKEDSLRRMAVGEQMADNGEGAHGGLGPVLPVVYLACHC
jgi:hypothetical protein